MSAIKYIIIDEMSMVGRKVFGQIDCCLRQAFPHNVWWVLHYAAWRFWSTATSHGPPHLHYRHTLRPLAYLPFDKAFTLTRIMRQVGQDPNQVHFRDILLRLRNAEITKEDWNCFMTQTPTNVADLTPFANTLLLHPTVEAVVEHNVAKLQASGQPIATIKAVRTGANAAKASPDDASGLEAVVCLAKSARVMLISNLWVDVGLVNGTMGYGYHRSNLFNRSGGPPDLPLAVMVKFDHYSGPTLHDGTVPITPI